jgi:hypothetical protein
VASPAQRELPDRRIEQPASCPLRTAAAETAIGSDAAEPTLRRRSFSIEGRQHRGAGDRSPMTNGRATRSFPCVVAARSRDIHFDM